MAYILHIFVVAFIPAFLREIESSQTQVVFYNKTEAYDPFNYGLNFGVGFNLPLPVNICSLKIWYLYKEWSGIK